VLFEPLLDTNPGVRAHRRRPGRPRRRPEKLHADKGYDYPRCRRYLDHRGIKVRIARRGIESSSHLGRVRWVVERSISWPLGFKRLGLRYDRTQHTLQTLACVLITCGDSCGKSSETRSYSLNTPPGPRSVGPGSHVAR
jgi:hypothetical protein